MPRLIHRVTVGFIAATLLLISRPAVHSGQARAQIVRRPVERRTPNWVGVSVGIGQGFTILDGSTGSTWDFGSGLEYAARFEHPVGRGAFAVGLQASYARLPVAYSSTAFTGDAKASVRQLTGVLRYGGGYGFHPVYELSGGAIGFSDFRSTDTQQLSISTSSDYDPKFSIGYGFGFGLSPTTSIEAVQEMGIVLHQRTGLSASQSNYPRVHVTRIGGKIAF